MASSQQVSTYCGCPDGYIPSSNNEDCVKITSVPATYSGTTYTGVGPKTDSAYGTQGTNFYEDVTNKPWPISAISSPLSLRDADSNLVNITNIVTTDVWGFSGGSRLNYCGIWADGTPDPLSGCVDAPCGEWIGFSKCITVSESGTYCIGIAGDNRVRFRLNGELVVQIDFPSPNTWAFNRWHVIPITLQAGTNIIELEGYNDNQVASFGAEIYHATVSELVAMTTYAQVTAVTIFTTRDQIGEPFNIGENSGYSCPDGYALNLCDTEPSCSLITRESYVVCSYGLVNCETGVVLNTVTDLSNSVGSIITIAEYDGCWQVGPQQQIPTTLTVTLVNTYISCSECVKKCYLLVDCSRENATIKTDVDLSAQVGLIVQIKSCPGVCWQVFEADNCDGEIVSVLATYSFETCEDCNPPVVTPTPDVLHARKVKPGYDTPGCSPEYTDRINCKFAEQVYIKAVKTRYGITPCCEDEYDKYLLKKEILDLQAIYDEDGCRSTCFTCKPPCGVSTELVVYAPIYCLAPENVESVITVIPGNCDAPTGVVSSSVKIYNRVFLPHYSDN